MKTLLAPEQRAAFVAWLRTDPEPVQGKSFAEQFAETITTPEPTTQSRVPYWKTEAGKEAARKYREQRKKQ